MCSWKISSSVRPHSSLSHVRNSFRENRAVTTATTQGVGSHPWWCHGDKAALQSWGDTRGTPTPASPWENGTGRAAACLQGNVRAPGSHSPGRTGPDSRRKQQGPRGPQAGLEPQPTTRAPGQQLRGPRCCAPPGQRRLCRARSPGSREGASAGGPAGRAARAASCSCQ